MRRTENPKIQVRILSVPLGTLPKPLTQLSLELILEANVPKDLNNKMPCSVKATHKILVLGLEVRILLGQQMREWRNGIRAWFRIKILRVRVSPPVHNWFLDLANVNQLLFPNKQDHCFRKESSQDLKNLGSFFMKKDWIDFDFYFFILNLNIKKLRREITKKA